MKVDFMIVGAQKSGTTTLADYLASHPEIAFCNTKEPGYFNANKDWKKNLNQYHALYKPGSNQILGEASTMYSILPESEGTAGRLYEYNPALKLLYIMRRPEQRIISHYSHRLVRKRVNGDINEEIKNDPAYLDRSRYNYQLTPFINTFPMGQIKLIIFEEFLKDPLKSLKSIAAFLEVNPEYFSEINPEKKSNASLNRNVLPDFGMAWLFNPLKKVFAQLPEGLKRFGLNLIGNKIQEKPVLNSASKKYIEESLRQEVRDIESLIGREVDEWH